MELSLSGNSLKTLTRSITCLARVGNELAIQASPSQLAFHTLNSSRSAYQSVIFKPEFFDVYTVSTALVQYSVLVKAVCAVLRTPVTSIDHLCVLLPDSDASKVQWTLECLSGMKKSYWITCNIEPDIQHLSLDRTKFPSSFVVRPRDFSRLLANFQSSLQEITVIATEPTSLPSDVASEIGGKAVELRSYIDPTKDDSDAALHTQLWIDPTEEFLQYVHTGDPVDVTFAVKELKAFLSFCEGCEVDIHLFFEKAGEPILMAPKFGLDDGSNSDFDVTLVLSTMLVSQLRERTPLDHQSAVEPRTSAQANQRTHERARGAASEHPSDHTRIWSELSGSAARSGSGAEGRQVEEQPSPHAASGQCGMERTTTMDMSKMGSSRGNMQDGHVQYNSSPPMETTHMDREEPQERDEMDGHGRTQHHPSNGAGAKHMEEPQERDEMDGHGRTQHHPSNGAGANHMEEPQVMNEMDGHGWTQHHPSNWVGADEDDDGDEDELCVQATPPY